MIQDLSLKTLAVMIDQYLKADPQTYEALAAYEGSRIRVELTNWGLDCHLVFQDEPRVQLEASRKALNPPDATIHTRLATLIQFILNPQISISELSNMTIEGNMSLVRHLAKIMQRMEIDWEEQLAYLTGDVIAHQAGQATRRAQHLAQDNWQNIKQNLSDYLHEELVWFPTRDELETFYMEVGQLRNDVDRAEAKLNYLFSQKA